MAVGAHEVPSLVHPGPMQRIPRAGSPPWDRDGTSAGRRRRSAGFPGEGKHLIAPAGEGRQILLQGIDAEGVGDLVFLQLPVRAVGRTKNLPSLRKKVEVTSECMIDALAKSPRTVRSFASCIAKSWCEPCHSAASPAWQPAHTAPPTKSACGASPARPTIGVARETHRRTAADMRARTISDRCPWLAPRRPAPKRTSGDRVGNVAEVPPGTDIASSEAPLELAG